MRSLCRRLWRLRLPPMRAAMIPLSFVQRFRYTTSIIYAASLRWAPPRLSLCLCLAEPVAGLQRMSSSYVMGCRLHAVTLNSGHLHLTMFPAAWST